MSRPDFRSANQIRPPSCSLGDVTEANGSCHFSQGNTEAIASVYGPSQPKYLRHEKFDEASFEVEFSITGSARTTALTGSSAGSNAALQRIEKSGAKFIRDSLYSCLNLKEYPRKMVYVKVCVLRDDGAMLSVALNAAAAALMDSGICMYFLPNSVTIIFPRNKSENSDILESGPSTLDPVNQEEKECESQLVFTINPCESLSQKLSDTNDIKENGSASDIENKNGGDNENEKFGIIHLLTIGQISLDQLQESVNLAKKSSSIIHEFLRRIVHDKLHLDA